MVLDPIETRSPSATTPILRRSFLDGIARNYSTLRQTRLKRRQDKPSACEEDKESMERCLKIGKRERSDVTFAEDYPLRRENGNGVKPQVSGQGIVSSACDLFASPELLCCEESVCGCAIDSAIALDVKFSSAMLFTCLATYSNGYFEARSIVCTTPPSIQQPLLNLRRKQKKKA